MKYIVLYLKAGNGSMLLHLVLITCQTCTGITLTLFTESCNPTWQSLINISTAPEICKYSVSSTEWHRAAKDFNRWESQPWLTLPETHRKSQCDLDFQLIKQASCQWTKRLSSVLGGQAVIKSVSHLNIPLAGIFLKTLTLNTHIEKRVLNALVPPAAQTISFFFLFF